MKRVPNRDRIKLVRHVLDDMPEDSVEKKVSEKYMKNYCDLDIKLELKISGRSLLDSRLKIKKLLLEAADGQMYEVRAVKK